MSSECKSSYFETVDLANYKGQPIRLDLESDADVTLVPTESSELTFIFEQDYTDDLFTLTDQLKSKGEIKVTYLKPQSKIQPYQSQRNYSVISRNGNHVTITTTSTTHINMSNMSNNNMISVMDDGTGCESVVMYDNSNQHAEPKGKFKLTCHIPKDYSSSLSVYAKKLNTFTCSSVYKLSTLEVSVQQSTKVSNLQTDSISCISSFGSIHLNSLKANKNVSCKNVSGKMEVSDIQAAHISLLNTSGKIEAYGCVAQNLTLENVSGSIYCEDSNIQTNLTAKSVSGSVNLSKNLKPLHSLSISSVSGSCRLRDVVASSMNISTISGSISARNKTAFVCSHISTQTISGSVSFQNISCRK